MKRKRIMVLGGGSSQLRLLKRCREMGLFVILADMNPQCSGRRWCDVFAEASTFDFNAIFEIARQERIHGIITTGTDQPVLACAKTAEKLHLPSFLDAPTALAVTNKAVMKQRINSVGIPTPRFRVLREDFSDADIAPLSLPLVIKPVDSQGQRGVFFVKSAEEVRKYFDEALKFSRQDHILAEEYYPGTEITVSGWVVDGCTHIYMVTDRVTFDQEPHIGICAAHRYPTMHEERHGTAVREITEALVSGFGIKNGPIYFQMLVGERGLMTNELACRIGGAYEDEVIPKVCGVPVLDLLIKGALGNSPSHAETAPKKGTEYPSFVTVPLLFSEECVIENYSNISEILSLPGVVSAAFLQPSGTVITELINSTQRIGYCIVEGETIEEVNARCRKVFSMLEVYSDTGAHSLKDSLPFCLHPMERPAWGK